MRFDELNLGPEVLEGLSAMNFKETTPVQELTIPVILEGRDLIACAQTGTGKTAAYILPLLNLLTKNKKKAMISLIPFIIASGFWILTLTDNLMLLQIMNANIARYGYVPISLKRMILSLTIYGIFIMTFLYGLYIIYKNQKSVLWPVYSIMFVGFASTIMFGFTPSIPSMERMYIFFYYGNMLAILIFIKQIIEKRIKT